MSAPLVFSLYAGVHRWEACSERRRNAIRSAQVYATTSDDHVREAGWSA